jgi:uncharacterized Rossmann fold enzyme
VRTDGRIGRTEAAVFTLTRDPIGKLAKIIRNSASAIQEFISKRTRLQFAGTVTSVHELMIEVGQGLHFATPHVKSGAVGTIDLIEAEGIEIHLPVTDIDGPVRRVGDPVDDDSGAVVVGQARDLGHGDGFAEDIRRMRKADQPGPV